MFFLIFQDSSSSQKKLPLSSIESREDGASEQFPGAWLASTFTLMSRRRVGEAADKAAPLESRREALERSRLLGAPFSSPASRFCFRSPERIEP
jgi:hypothetical protein